MNLREFLLPLVASVLAICSQESWSDSIEVNGGFEAPIVGPGGYATYYSGQSASGWTVGNGSIDFVSSVYWQPASGQQSIDLGGNDAGSIYQELNTVLGETYLLSFAMAGNPLGPWGAGPRVKVMAVYWGGELVDTLSFDANGHTSSDMGWAYHQYSLTATAATTRLRFESLGPSGPLYGAWGAALDDVLVTPAAVPEGWDLWSNLAALAPLGFLLFAARLRNDTKQIGPQAS